MEGSEDHSTPSSVPPHVPLHPTQPGKAPSLRSPRLQPLLCFARSVQPVRHEPSVPQGQGDQRSPPIHDTGLAELISLPRGLAGTKPWLGASWCNLHAAACPERAPRGGGTQILPHTAGGCHQQQGASGGSAAHPWLCWAGLGAGKGILQLLEGSGVAVSSCCCSHELGEAQGGFPSRSLGQVQDLQGGCKGLGSRGSRPRVLLHASPRQFAPLGAGAFASAPSSHAAGSGAV